MSVIDDLIEAKIEEFDAVLELNTDGEERCFLLIKEDFQTSDYAVLQELTSGYYFYFALNFNFFNLQYATLDREFKKIVPVVTHIALGEVVYELPANNRIVFRPTFEYPFYQFLCKETGETFTPPA